MHTWKRGIFGAAAVLAGCSGSIDDPGMGGGNVAPGGPGDPAAADDGTPATNPDGTPATVPVLNPDGTPVLNPDGTPVTVPAVNPDGTPVAAPVSPDGTPVAAPVSPDGTPVTNPDGTPVTAPDGTPVTTGGTTCVPGVPQTSQLPRLTRAQYDNTIRDLFGITSQPSSLLAPDTPGSVDQRAWDGYQAAAKAVAEEVSTNAAARARVITCTPDADGTACANQVIAEFGLKAFRRPLTEAETTRFQNIYAQRAELTATGTFDEAMDVIIEAFLVSPSFLTRAEISEQPEGTVYALNSYEVASRLSYMLWGTMPDDALFAEAAANRLSTPQEIIAQAQRMLLDDKARSQVARFHEQYAHMGPGTRWAEITRDTNVFPAFDEGLVPVLSEETERLFDHIVFGGGTFQDLLTSPVAFVNASTAPLYGLDPAQFGAELEPVTLDASAGRPGIFTRLGFLASHSNFDRTSPILRGAFLQKEVLCTDIPAPPPGVAGTPLPTEGLTTNRERVDAQTSPADCVTCHHVVINPTGYALESFDAIGAVQTMDNGVPVDTTASIPVGSTFVNVTGPVDLMTVIANSTQAQRCYAEKWVQYAYERDENPADACVADGMAAKITQGGYSVLDLIADLTQSDSFRYRAIETEVAQ